MKKTLFLILALACTAAARSQVLISLILGDNLNTGKIEFGLDGGMSLSTIQGAQGAENRMGFNLGFYFDIKTKHPQWMVNTGVVVKGPMGANGLPVYALNDPDLDAAFDGGSVNTKLNYFYVPICMKYTFKSRIFLRGGIQPGLFYGATDEFVNTVKDEDDLTYKLNRKKDFSLLDFGLVTGMGYRLMKGYGMNVGINYYHGLIDVESGDAGPNLYNRAFYFNVGIPIGKGKAQKKQNGEGKNN